jgi:Fuc2NAc and GlcNAc transferase
MLSRELALFVTATVLSAVATWLIRRHAVDWGLLDVPNARSSHTQPTPRGGGLAIVVTVLAAVLIAGLLRELPIVDVAALVGGGMVVAAIGYYDDLKPLSALPRFAVHLMAAVMLVGMLAGVDSVLAHPRWLAFSALVVAVLWSINLFNFMDGIDGIAASQAVFVSTASAVLIGVLRDPVTPWLILPVVTAGACLGFLVWNWPPARIFMGDVGSGFLGFWLAAMALALDRADMLRVWTSVILGSVFIADATVTLLRRVARRERWHQAHRSHAYQNLARRWRSHRRVTLLVWIINLAVVFPLAALSVFAPGFAPQIAGATLCGFGLLALLAGAGVSGKAA